MTKTREKLIDRVIKKFGYEGKETIEIATLCEVLENNPVNDLIIEQKVEEYENKPLEDDEEEVEDAEIIFVIGITRDGKHYRKPRT